MAPLVLSDNHPDLWQRLGEFDLSVSVIVSPTDTVYGFSTSYRNREGIERISRLKGGKKPFIVLFREWSELTAFARVSTWQFDVLHRYWPGAITFVLESRCGNSTIGLRQPNHPLLRKLMLHSGDPMVSTSCNPHGERPVGSIHSAIQYFGSSVDIYIDGRCPSEQLPSTLVDLTRTPPMVLRQGAVSFVYP